jgi:hypothetical protein
VEDDLDNDENTMGDLLTMQFFNVVRAASITSALSYGSDTCFIGDRVNMSLTLANISSWPTNIRVQHPSLNFGYAAGSVGSVTLLTTTNWGYTFLPAGQSITYNRTVQAVSDSGLTGSCTMSMNANQWYYNEYNTGAAPGNPVQLSTGPLRIFRKIIDVASTTLDFGTCDPGALAASLTTQVRSLGNHALPLVNFARVDLRTIATETLPASNILLAPAPVFAIGTSAIQTLETAFQVPYNQPAGNFFATMAFYDDHNRSGAFETSDPNDLVMVKIQVASVAKAVMVDEIYDLGYVLPGAVSASKTIEFVGVGNRDIVRLKFSPVSPCNFEPLVPGAYPTDGYGTAAVSVTIPALQPPGEYSAIGTLYNDIDNDNVVDAGEAPDTFTIRWKIGTPLLAISPTYFPFGAGTPTYLLPDLPMTITNTGLVPLDTTRGETTEFINFSQPGMVGTDDVALSGAPTIAVGGSAPGTATVYIPGGSATGTYLATFTWFEDLNDNRMYDAGEAFDRGLASFVALGYTKIYSLSPTVDLGGTKAGTAKEVTFQIRNAGSLDIPVIRYEPVTLVKGADSINVTNLTIAPDPWLNLARGALAGISLTVNVPPGQPYGVYGQYLTIYADLDVDGVRDPDEAWCRVWVRIEIGDQQLDITAPASINLAGIPGSATTPVSFSVKNTGSLTLSRVRVQATDLVGPVTIASTTAFFQTSANVGGLLLTQVKSVNAGIHVPIGQTAGTYNGYIWAWEDGNNDGVRQIAEAAASVPLELTLPFNPSLNTSPGLIDLGVAALGETASAGFLAQNTGNMSLSDVRWQILALDAGGPQILPAQVTIAPSPIGFMATPPVGLPLSVPSTMSVVIPMGAPDGLYQGTFNLFEDSWNPAANIYDVGSDPVFVPTVQVLVATPFIDFTPAVVATSGVLPQGKTLVLSSTVSNSGTLLPLIRLRWVAEDLVHGGDLIPAGAITLSPATFPILAPGATRPATVTVLIASHTPPGLYAGNMHLYDDRNNNGIFDAWESEGVLTVQVTVADYPLLQILTTTLDFGKVARNTSSELLPLGIFNPGNKSLTGFACTFVDMFDTGGHFIPAASMTFTAMVPDPVLPGGYATGQVKIGPVGPVQEIATYTGLPNVLAAAGAIDSFRILCDVISGGPQGLSSGTVRQEVATSVFPIPPALPQRYILSAMVCPGTGSARLAFIATDFNGKGWDTASYAFEIWGDGSVREYGGIAQGGILERLPVTHPVSGDSLAWYRVYIAFDYLFDQAVASKTYLLLENTSPITDHYAVWFDGVQLEQGNSAGQVQPTTFHGRKKIISPNPAFTIRGDGRYSEW